MNVYFLWHDKSVYLNVIPRPKYSTYVIYKLMESLQALMILLYTKYNNTLSHMKACQFFIVLKGNHQKNIHGQKRQSFLKCKKRQKWMLLDLCLYQSCYQTACTFYLPTKPYCLVSFIRCCVSSSSAEIGGRSDSEFNWRQLFKLFYFYFYSIWNGFNTPHYCRIFFIIVTYQTYILIYYKLVSG